MRKHIYDFEIQFTPNTTTKFEGLTLENAINHINDYFKNNNIDYNVNYQKLYNFLNGRGKCILLKAMIKNLKKHQINNKGELVVSQIC